MNENGKVYSSVFCIVIVAILIIGMVVKAEAGSIRLSMADFIPDGYAYNTYGNEYFKSFGGGTLEATGTGVTCLAAPVKFPAAAIKVKSGTVYAIDNNASSDSWFCLYSVEMTTGIANDLGCAYTSGNSGVIEPFAFTFDTKALSKSAQYYVGTCTYPDISIYGVKLNYVVP
jgi:hypothetical protein